MKTKVLRQKRGKGKRVSPNGGWVRDGELSRLRNMLTEAQDTLEAIRSGAVDAVVVAGPRGHQVYSLAGADQPYRIYVERMQEGAVTVSADGLILYCNHRFAEMMQTPLEQVIGSRITAHLGESSWNRIAGVFESEEDVIKSEFALYCRDGNRLSVNLTASRLPLPAQKVMCLVVTDLTEHKKQEKLQMAKDLAEKASQAKDAFLAALSHELRTPLTPVLIITHALEQEGAISAEVRDALSLIRRNVELEARLIDDLLDLTRIARGKLELSWKETDFHAAIQRALEICRPEFTAKSQNIQLQLNAVHHCWAADGVRTQQAVWNVLRNAIKFTSPHGLITIRTSNPLPGQIAIEIHDTGIGFDPGCEGKLFQAFEQGGRHITRQFGGLGLGLAITRSIIEAHGGAIVARSAGMGKGATFTLTFPRRLSKAADGEKSAAPAANHFTPKRILLVEDHLDTRVTLQALLERHRHLVMAAASAGAAIKLAEQNEFDLVISDIGLPDRTGFELMAQLRDRFGLKGIGLTGYGMREDIANARQAGFVQHLTKPIRFESLTAAIAEISSGR